MCKRIIVVLLSCLLLSTVAFAEQFPQKRKVDVVTFWAQQQFDTLPPAGKGAIAVHFELENDWHFYASDDAPGGMNLKIEPNEQGEKFLKFGKPIWPKSERLYDPTLEENLEVFSGRFTVYLPFTVVADAVSYTHLTLPTN